MKKVITLLSAALLAANVQANEVHGDVAVYSGTETGVYMDAGYENTRLELILVGDLVGFNVKQGFSFSDDAKLWVGAGQYATTVSTSDYSDTWDNTTYHTPNISYGLMAELDFTTDWFIRVMRTYDVLDVNYRKTDIDGNLIDSKLVSHDVSETSVWVGYKFRF